MNVSDIAEGPRPGEADRIKRIIAAAMPNRGSRKSPSMNGRCYGRRNAGVSIVQHTIQTHTCQIDTDVGTVVVVQVVATAKPQGTPQEALQCLDIPEILHLES